MNSRTLAVIMGAVMASISAAYLTQDHGWVMGATVGGAIGAGVALLILLVTRKRS